MSVEVANSRFISFSSQKFGALYQHLFRNISGFQKLGEKLIQEANVAHSFRQVSRMEDLGIMLSNIPIREYQLIGQYYIGWAQCLKGESPERLLEEVIEQSQTHKAKALISLAGIKAQKNDYPSELHCFTEALKCANSPSTRIEALRGIAIVKAKEGFNKLALQDLEAIIPLARYGGVRVCHDYMNSYAVELKEVGRIEEAANISRIVLASPFAFAYPEWRETGNEIALRGYKSRSIVSFRQKKPENLLHLPERKRSESIRRNPFFYPSDVTQMADWKKKMGKEPNGDGKDKQPLTDRQMVMKIMDYVTDYDLPDEVLYQMLEAVEKISHSFKSKKDEE